MKYVKNVLQRYEQDGLSYQRYERQSQHGAGDDILAGNCMTVVGLYRDIYGLQPKYNRLYLEPHLTAELNGTQLRYQLRGQSYAIDLSTAGSRMAVDDFAVRATQPFAINAKGDTADFFAGDQDKPALSVRRSREAPLEIEIVAWPASQTGARQWIESASSRSVKVRHEVSNLQPHGTYRLLVNGKKAGSFAADSAGRIEFKRTLHYAKPEQLELLVE